MFISDNDKRRLGIAAIGSLVAAFIVAALVAGDSTAVAKTDVPPLGSMEVTAAFNGITAHVEQKPLPPGYTRTVDVSVERTPTDVTRTVTRTVHYRSGSSWWTRGPVRRFLSAPFRNGLFRRWRR